MEGFTSIRSAALELNDVNVLVGANGAGKSNLIRALGMLGRIVDGELGLYVGLSGGASALLNADPTEPRRIRLQVESDAGGYSAELVPAAGDTLIFSDEAVSVRNTGVLTSTWTGSPGDSANVYRATVGAGGGNPSSRPLRGCRVFHFHDTSRGAPVKQQGYTADNRSLHSDAGNLAAVMLRLRGRRPRTLPADRPHG